MVRTWKLMWTGGLAVLLVVVMGHFLAADEAQQPYLNASAASQPTPPTNPPGPSPPGAQVTKVLADSSGAAAGIHVGDLTPDELVKTLTVTIFTSDQGEDLDEPVALDLGLGFPLWLYPVGWSAGQEVPFGAIAQKATAQSKIQAGSSATFTFDVAGQPGQDVLQTTPQLLAGVRVSDIHRVGLASARASDWILQGYELKINGADFAEDKSGVPQPDPAQTALAAKVAELDQSLTALRKEYDQLRALDEDKATDSDRQRLKQIETEAIAAYQQKTSLESQLQINSKSAKDTREDDVRKLTDVESRIQALQWESASVAKPQQAQDSLDSLLKRKRLLEGRLRGEYPWFGDADFQPVRKYGEKTPLIQSATVTLETCTHAGADTRNYVYFFAGRHKYLLNSVVIPLTGEEGPQQFTLDLTAAPLTTRHPEHWGLGMLARPSPYALTPDRWHPRRVTVEIDGKVVYDSEQESIDRRSLQAIRLIPAAHLDGKSQVVENHPTSREVYVWQVGSGDGLDAETGKPLPLPAPSAPDYPQAEPGLSEGPPPPGLDMPTFPPGADPFPGESHPGPGWQPPPSGGPGWTPPPAWQPPPGWQPPPPGAPPTGSTPLTTGQPFHVKSVRVTNGWNETDAFTIEWDCSGDQSQISHFHVSLRVVRPDRGEVYFAAIMKNDKVPVGARKWTGSIDKLIAGQIKEPYYFVAPMVVAVPKDAKQSSPHHECIGRARAIFPANANPAQQPLPRWYTFTDSASGSTTPKKPFRTASRAPPAQYRRSTTPIATTRSPSAAPAPARTSVCERSRVIPSRFATRPLTSAASGCWWPTQASWEPARGATGWTSTWIAAGSTSRASRCLPTGRSRELR